METHISTSGKADSKVIFGVNASYEQKDQVASSGNLRATFEGEQSLLGADIRLMHNSLMLSGEFIYSWLEDDFGIQSNPFGYHATAGYYVTPQIQFLVRWDRFEGDGLAGDNESFLAGLNYFPTSFTEVQLNYMLPAEGDIEYSRLLLKLQVNF